MSDRLTNECEELRTALGAMRACVGKLEQALPRASGLAMELRAAMIDVTARANAIQATVGGKRMTGEEPQRVAQEPVEEMPLFFAQPREVLPKPDDADGVSVQVEVWTGSGIAQRTLSPEELLRMEATLHRAGDHTQDHQDREGAATEQHGR